MTHGIYRFVIEEGQSTGFGTLYSLQAFVAKPCLHAAEANPFSEASCCLWLGHLRCCAHGGLMRMGDPPPSVFIFGSGRIVLEKALDSFSHSSVLGRRPAASGAALRFSAPMEESYNRGIIELCPLAEECTNEVWKGKELTWGIPNAAFVFERYSA